MHLQDDAHTTQPVVRGPQSRTDVGDTEVARAIADPAGASPPSMVELQRLAGNATVSRLLSPENDDTQGERSSVLDVVGQGGGRPLDTPIRREMEARLGADFGDVRLHTDSKASDSARAVNANAYTVGREVVVRDDRWSPETNDGKKTLAHELTHVVQQRSGPVSGTDTGGGIRVSHPDDSFERAAEHSASAALAAGVPSPAVGPATATAQREEPDRDDATAQTEYVQRDEDEDEPEEGAVQGEFVQRAEDEEQEEENPPAG